MDDNITFDQLPNAVFQLYEKLNSIENLLLNQTSQSESDQLLSIQQAGELIKLSVPTIYGYVSRNEIPFSKKGKRLYFSKQELFHWIQEGRKKTISETKEEANTFVKIKHKGGIVK